MSDLQCPATFLVIGAAADAQVPAARLAAVYAVSEGAAAASTWAGQAGLAVTALEAGTSYRAALAELADLHRGETVLVVLPDAAVGDLAAPVGGGAVLEVVVDADGWVVRIWTSSSNGTQMRA